MAYGNKPAGKAKPSLYPYGTAGSGTEMVAGKKSVSKETNKGPGLVVGGRVKGFTRSAGKKK